MKRLLTIFIATAVCAFTSMAQWRIVAGYGHTFGKTHSVECYNILNVGAEFSIPVRDYFEFSPEASLYTQWNSYDYKKISRPHNASSTGICKDTYIGLKIDAPIYRKISNRVSLFTGPELTVHICRNQRISGEIISSDYFSEEVKPFSDSDWSYDDYFKDRFGLFWKLGIQYNIDRINLRVAYNQKLKNQYYNYHPKNTGLLWKGLCKFDISVAYSL